MKDKLIAVTLISTFFLFQQTVTAEISDFKIKIDKTECQFGVDEEQLWNIAYSHFNSNNISVLKNSDIDSDTYARVNIKCPKQSEFVSLLFDLEIIQNVRLNHKVVEGIVYSDVFFAAVNPQDFNKIEQEGLITILERLIYSSQLN